MACRTKFSSTSRSTSSTTSTSTITTAATTTTRDSNQNLHCSRQKLLASSLGLQSQSPSPSSQPPHSPSTPPPASSTPTDLQLLLPSGRAKVSSMAGDIRVVDGKKPRKLWTLQDRSVMSVHLLKANLAEEGCEEAQLDVAKKLLQDSADCSAADSSQRENARLAVYWLIKSSEQGNEEGTRLLEECLSSGRGITGQNILDVHICVNTPKNEKLTFKAARVLQEKLNNGEEFITTTQLLSRIQSVTKKKVTFEENEESPNSEFVNPQKCETERERESVIVEEEGNIEPSGFDPNRTFILSSRPRVNSLRGDAIFVDSSVGIIGSSTHQSLEYLLSQEGVKMTMDDLIKAAGAYNSGEVPQPSIDSYTREIGRHDWKLCSNGNALIGMILILVTITGVASLTKCTIFGVSFVSVWTAYNLLMWRRRHYNFKDWTEAFKSVLREGSWSGDSAEIRLTYKSLVLYVIVNGCSLLVLSILRGENFLKSLVGSLTVISLIRGVFQSPIPSWQMMAVFSIKLLPSFSIPFKGVENYFGLEVTETILMFVSKLPQDLFPFTLPDWETLTLTVCVIILSSLFWKRKAEILQKTLPELLYGLWVLKLINISTKFNQEDYYVVGISMGVLIMILLLLDTRIDSCKLILGVLVAFSTVISIGVIMISVGYVDKNINSIEQPNKLDRLKLLEWEEYDKNCHRGAWTSQSVAETQFKCSLKYAIGTPSAVRWKGRVVVIKVKEMQWSEDHVAQDVSFEIAANILASDKNPDTTAWHNFLQGSETPELSAPVSILVSTQHFSSLKEKHNFIDHILNLRNGDKIELYGQLEPTTVGSLKPEIIELESLQCLSCAVADYGNFLLKSTESKSLESGNLLDIICVYLTRLKHTLLTTITNNA